MLEIIYSTNFIRRLRNLEPSLQDEILEKINEFKNPKNHNKLKVHKLNGRMSKFYSFSVNFQIRILFEYGKNKKIASLLYVGKHDDLYRFNP